jgi:hypothetical protein
MPREILSVVDVQDEYGLGRDLTLAVCNNLPRFYVGRRGLRVHRIHLERVLSRASQEKADLWEIVKTQPGTLTKWAGGANDQ